MSPFAKTVCAALLFAVCSQVGYQALSGAPQTTGPTPSNGTESLLELRQAAEKASQLRIKLAEKSHVPRPVPASAPQARSPNARRHSFTSVPARPTSAQLAWIPSVGQVLRGTHYQQYDGGVNPAHNNEILFNWQLTVLSVSNDRRVFTGELIYGDYIQHGKRTHWPAKAVMVGRISGTSCTLEVTRSLYVPPGTMLSRATHHGLIANNEIFGKSRGIHGATGNFRFSLPNGRGGESLSSWLAR